MGELSKPRTMGKIATVLLALVPFCLTIVLVLAYPFYAFAAWYGPYKEGTYDGCINAMGADEAGPLYGRVKEIQPTWKWILPGWSCVYVLDDGSVRTTSLSDRYGFLW
jgi:hypothetical protein